MRTLINLRIIDLIPLLKVSLQDVTISGYQRGICYVSPRFRMQLFSVVPAWLEWWNLKEKYSLKNQVEKAKKWFSISINI